MVYRMFPPASLNTLSNTIESSSFSAQDFINEQLKQGFLPFPWTAQNIKESEPIQRRYRDDSKRKSAFFRYEPEDGR